MTIKLQQLAHALALSRYGSFSRAAQAQNLSQPAFSRSIRTLEDALGVPLFERQTPVITPTLYGEALLKRAEAVIAEAADLEREIQLLRGLESGTFAVAMGAYAAELSGQGAVGRLMREHPGLRCRVMLGNWREVAARVLERSVDIGLAEISALSASERLQVEAVGAHQMVFYCRDGHPLLARDRVSIGDLDDFPLASIRIPPRGADLMPGLWTLDESIGDLAPHAEVDDVATARAIIQASDAFGCATPIQLEPWLTAGELRVLPLRAPWLKLDYGFIYQKDRMLSPAAERFIAMVREIEAGLVTRNLALMERFLPGGGSP